MYAKEWQSDGAMARAGIEFDRPATPREVVLRESRKRRLSREIVGGDKPVVETTRCEQSRRVVVVFVVVVVVWDSGRQEANRLQSIADPRLKIASCFKKMHGLSFVAYLPEPEASVSLALCSLFRSFSSSLSLLPLSVLCP